jgi:hypothetical protein
MHDVIGNKRQAGCPSARRNALTGPTRGLSPVAVSVEAASPFAQVRVALAQARGRADALKRRRMARDDFLGREKQLSQSPRRKARRQTLNRCLVQPAYAADARPVKAPPATENASRESVAKKKLRNQSASGVCALDRGGHIDVGLNRSAEEEGVSHCRCVNVRGRGQWSTGAFVGNVPGNLRFCSRSLP